MSTTRQHRCSTSRVPLKDQPWARGIAAALTISAMGLVAGGVAASSSGATIPQPVLSVPAAVVSVSPSAPGSSHRAPSPLPQAASLDAFDRREQTAQDTSRTSGREPLVEAQVSQRQNALAKKDRTTQRRSQRLLVATREDQLADTATKVLTNARRIAAERRAAIAARSAAERDAKAKAAQAVQQPTQKSPELTPVDKSGSTGGSAPVAGAVIGAQFGAVGSWSRYHTGLDFRAGYGTPIRAAQSGVVTFAGSSGNWAGTYVAIRHSGGESTQSSHMSALAVATGDRVKSGQIIGYVGNTGRSFGAHLHFELYPAGVAPGDVYRAIDPKPWLAANGVTTR